MTKLSFDIAQVVAFAGGEAGEISVDVSKLNATVQAYVFQYGLKQMLNDVHASVTKKVEPDDAKRVAGKQALVQKKLDSLYAGEVAQARVGQTGNPVERKMRELAEVDLKAKLRTIGKKPADYDKQVWAQVVAKQVAVKADAYRTAAEAILAVKVEQVEDDFDIMSLIEEATEE